MKVNTTDEGVDNYAYKVAIRGHLGTRNDRGVHRMNTDNAEPESHSSNDGYSATSTSPPSSRLTSPENRRAAGRDQGSHQGTPGRGEEVHETTGNGQEGEKESEDRKTGLPEERSKTHTTTKETPPSNSPVHEVPARIESTGN